MCPSADSRCYCVEMDDGQRGLAWQLLQFVGGLVWLRWHPVDELACWVLTEDTSDGCQGAAELFCGDEVWTTDGLWMVFGHL